MPDRSRASHRWSGRYGLSLVLLVALVLLPGCGRATQAATGRPVVATDVAFWGDSLTEGFPRPPFRGDGSDSLAGVFAASDPGGTVYNGGVSGQSAAEIALRQGGLTLRVTVAGGVIPASGTVALTTTDVLGWRLDREWFCEGSLAGVAGTVTRSGSTLRFERAARGAPVPVRGVQPFVSQPSAEHRDFVQVLFAGRNDIGYPSPAGKPADRVVQTTDAMVDFLPRDGRVLICGPTTATDEREGTAGYDEVVGINARLAAEHPYSYWDLRGWLVHDALGAMGIAPTPADLSSMAADTLPPSLMVPGDTVHYSPATAAALAGEIRSQLERRGWLAG